MNSYFFLSTVFFEMFCKYVMNIKIIQNKSENISQTSNYVAIDATHRKSYCFY